MSAHELVNAWKDLDLRESGCQPAHPAGEIELPAPDPAGGMMMDAMMISIAGTEPIGTMGCCYCNCGCGIQYGCNREACNGT